MAVSWPTVEEVKVTSQREYSFIHEIGNFVGSRIAWLNKIGSTVLLGLVFWQKGILHKQVSKKISVGDAC